MVNKKTKDTPNGCPFYLAICNYNKKDSPKCFAQRLSLYSLFNMHLRPTEQSF